MLSLGESLVVFCGRSIRNSDILISPIVTTASARVLSLREVRRLVSQRLWEPLKELLPKLAHERAAIALECGKKLRLGDAVQVRVLGGLLEEP